MLELTGQKKNNGARKVGNVLPKKSERSARKLLSGLALRSVKWKSTHAKGRGFQGS